MADELDKPPLDRAPVDEHVSVARLAAKPDIGTEAVDQPVVTTARMLTSEPDEVPEVQGERQAVGHPAEGIKDADDHDQGRGRASRRVGSSARRWASRRGWHPDSSPRAGR